MLYRNKKNGKIYMTLGEVTNCTNAQDGQRMVHYCTKLKNGEFMYFVRELREFREKFEYLANIDE